MTDVSPATDAEIAQMEKDALLHDPMVWNWGCSDILSLIARIHQERDQAIRECASVAKNWIEDWGTDLQATCDAYIDATKTGTFNGRRIDPQLAKASARQFKERADAVYDCGAQVATALLALLPTPPALSQEERT